MAKDGKGQVPVYITLRSKRLFALAGLYENWKVPAGHEIRTCTIITTNSNDLVRPFHDRMPVILPETAEDHWLDPDEHDRTRLQAFLQPYPSDEMDAYDVSTVVNNTRHDTPDCISPAAK